MGQAYELPGAALSALNVHVHFICTILQGEYYHCSHFIDEKLKQRAESPKHKLGGNRGEVQTLTSWLYLLCSLFRAHCVYDRHRAVYLSTFSHILLRTILEDKCQHPKFTYCSILIKDFRIGAA